MGTNVWTGGEPALLRGFCHACGDAGPPPRTAVVVAHPDDEVIGAGGRLQSVTPALLVHTTDGAPRDLADAQRAGCSTRAEYAALRAAEREAAADLLGIPPAARRQLPIVDQEAALELQCLTLRCAILFVESRAELVVTHPYEGGHPDHDATAFAVHSACALLRYEGYAAPAVAELTSYHADRGDLAVGRFLDGAAVGHELIVPLDDDLRARKRRLVACYASQQPVLAQFPIADEHFRLAPAYDFRRPPHDGALYYEHFGWGMTAERWCRLASDALRALELPVS